MTKDNTEALKCILTGNYYYEKQQWCEALIEYNRGLCFAEPTSHTVAILYGKRAVVYFDLKEYPLCLANIELAQRQNYHVGFRMLEDLKYECIYMMQTHIVQEDEDPMNFFKLSHPANARLPCLAQGLQLRVNKKYGRHIVATRDFKVGDIIALSNFSFIFFDKRARLHHCSHCTKSSMKLSLIPCRGCSKGKFFSLESYF